jgi:general secretion pathway protein L
MADYLVIRLGSDPEHAASWIAVDGNGAARSSPVTGPLAEAAAATAGRSVIVLVSATAVLTTTVDIPIRGGHRLQAALPFALEEHLAEDVDSLHFAAGKRRDSGQIPVAVVALEQMQSWLNLLETAGISAAQIIPENNGLAIIPGTVSMLIADNQIMVNDGADNEFVMQDTSPSDVLAIAGVLQDPAVGSTTERASEAPARHLLVYCEPEDEERFQTDWIALRSELASVDINLLSDGALPRLAITVASGRGINLLQGRFGPKTELAALFKPWRNVAMLLLGLAIVSVAGTAVEYYRLVQDESSLKAQFTDMYREILPNDTRDIVDPVSTVNSIRRSVGAPVAAQVFLPSLQQLGAALQENAAAKIEAITYRAGVVDVRLTAPDVATLDNIQRMVGDSGRFSASIQSTDQVGDKVSSRIQIRESGA